MYWLENIGLWIGLCRESRFPSGWLLAVNATPNPQLFAAG